MHDNAHWILTNVYDPCSHPEKREFIQWFKNINMSDSIGWIIMGDFNLCRSPEDRNQPGGIMLKCICSTKQLAFLALLKFP